MVVCVWLCARVSGGSLLKYYSVLFLVYGGCGGPLSDLCQEPIGDCVSFIETHKVPWDEPAVGELMTPGGRCTATHIGNGIAVTAGHCVDGHTGSYRGRFRLNGRSYQVFFSVAYADGVSVKDVAFVRFLAASYRGIPSLQIAERAPKDGDSLRLVGFGCLLGCMDASGAVLWGFSGTERKADFTAENFSYTGYRSGDFSVCPGDSGGPVIDIRTKKIVAIVSGSGIPKINAGYKTKYFANPIRYRGLFRTR